MSRFFAFCIFTVMSSLSWSQAIVVSTHPIYLIAEKITEGVEKPTLLLKDQSGHDVTLTPAHRKTIQEAELVVWLGPQHEAPLNKLLVNNASAISILESGIVQTLPQRDARGKAIKGTLATHVWLDPNNAVRIGFFIAALRSQQKPEFKAEYWANAQKFAKDMLLAANKLNTTSAAKPYWSFHDAYQYLERSLNLKFSGALTTDSHMAPTVTQIKYLNDNRPMTKMCLLAEGHASKNQYQKLGDISFQKVDESMNGEGDFVVGWANLTQEVQKCVLSTRK